MFEQGAMDIFDISELIAGSNEAMIMYMQRNSRLQMHVQCQPCSWPFTQVQQMGTVRQLYLQMTRLPQESDAGHQLKTRLPLSEGAPCADLLRGQWNQAECGRGDSSYVRVVVHWYQF